MTIDELHELEGRCDRARNLVRSLEELDQAIDAVKRIGEGEQEIELDLRVRSGEGKETTLSMASAPNVRGGMRRIVVSEKKLLADAASALLATERKRIAAALARI